MSGAAWIEPPVRGPLRPMSVKVLTDDGRRFEYDAMFRSTFDGYDAAISRFPHAARVEVKPKAQPTPEAGHAQR